MKVRYRYKLAWFLDHMDRFECEPILVEFETIKDTPQGAWITYRDKKKFVLNGSGKRFAHENKEFAFEYFVYRNLSYKNAMKRKVRCIENMLEKIEYRKFLPPND